MSEDAVKECTICGMKKALTREHFYVQAAARDGFDQACKLCRNARQRSSYGGRKVLGETEEAPRAEHDAATLANLRRRLESMDRAGVSAIRDGAFVVTREDTEKVIRLYEARLAPSVAVAEPEALPASRMPAADGWRYCTRCEVPKPETEEYFNPGNKDGTFAVWCRECQIENSRKGAKRRAA